MSSCFWIVYRSKNKKRNDLKNWLSFFSSQPGGCEHFRCPQCSTEFCRICSALFYNPQHNTVRILFEIRKWIQLFCIDLSETKLLNEKDTSCTLLFELFSRNSRCWQWWDYSIVNCSFCCCCCFIFIWKSLFKAHRVNVNEELRQKPQASSPKCPVEGCTRAASATCENRFCE